VHQVEKKECNKKNERKNYQQNKSFFLTVLIICFAELYGTIKRIRQIRNKKNILIKFGAQIKFFEMLLSYKTT